MLHFRNIWNHEKELQIIHLKWVFAQGFSYLIQIMQSHLQTEIIHWVSFPSVHSTGGALKHLNSKGYPTIPITTLGC